MWTAGTIVDERYTVISKLGQGGIGAVYKVRQARFDREIALKVLSLPDCQESLQRFTREAQALSKLRHRNIVSVYSYGTWQGSAYMTMELISGESLASVLCRVGALDLPKAISVIEQVAEALFCAHSHGIIHRD